MKKIFLMLVILTSAYVSKAQNGIQYTIKWNSTQSRYEVYAKPNFTQSNFPWGFSQVGVVTPSAAPNTIVVTSSAVTGWTVGAGVFAPSAQSANDFFGVSTNGSTVSLTANTESLLFSFTFQGGQCFDGVRLFVNNVDPSSSAAGMNGGDFRNGVYNDLGVQHYTSNYSNTGTQCNSCSITAPELSKQ